MKHQWLAYVIVGVLSVGAGVAIAGLPDNVPVDATIIPPTTTEAPAPTLPETTVAPATTVPESTVPDTTAPDARESETTTPTATEPNESPDDLPARSELTVAAVNGANVAGAAVRVATQLEEIGYVDVLSGDGTPIAEFTTVYFTDGFEDAALRLAADLDLLPEFVEPIEDAPSVSGLDGDIDLLAFIGLDRA